MLAARHSSRRDNVERNYLVFEIQASGVRTKTNVSISHSRDLTGLIAPLKDDKPGRTLFLLFTTEVDGFRDLSVQYSFIVRMFGLRISVLRA